MYACTQQGKVYDGRLSPNNEFYAREGLNLDPGKLALEALCLTLVYWWLWACIICKCTWLQAQHESGPFIVNHSQPGGRPLGRRPCLARRQNRTSLPLSTDTRQCHFRVDLATTFVTVSVAYKRVSTNQSGCHYAEIHVLLSNGPKKPGK